MAFLDADNVQIFLLVLIAVALISPGVFDRVRQSSGPADFEGQLLEEIRTVQNRLGELNDTVQSVNDSQGRLAKNNELTDKLDQNRFVEEDFAQEATLSDLNLTTDGYVGMWERTHTAFLDKKTVTRTNIIDLSSNHRISELRNNISEVGGGTVNNTGAGEHRLHTASGDSRVELKSDERGVYTPGYIAQAGVGLRIPEKEKPANNEVIRWGLFTKDNGFYFGKNATCTFVAIRRGGSQVMQTCQSNWNENTLSSYNASNGYIYRISYAWYGYGTIQFQIINGTDKDETLIPVHTFRPERTTSVDEPNLPINVEVDNVDSNGAATDVYVGGRQYSIWGRITKNERLVSDRRDSVTTNSSTSWTHLATIKKNNSFREIGVDIVGLSTLAECDSYFQIRAGTNQSHIGFVTPDDTPTGETAVVVNDTGGVDVTKPGSSELRGIKIYEDVLEGDQGSAEEIGGATDILTTLPPGETTSILVQRVSGSTACDLTGNVVRWREQW